MMYNLVKQHRQHEEPWYDITTDDGSIRWSLGTGFNVELTYLKTTEVRVGGGTRLLIQMLRSLKQLPPYHTVYGFTRTSNLSAQEFYQAMGFTLTAVNGVYKDGTAVLFSAVYADLCKLHGVM